MPETVTTDGVESRDAIGPAVNGATDIAAVTERQRALEQRRKQYREGVWFRLTTHLLYPAVLGAGLAWLVSGVGLGPGLGDPFWRWVSYAWGIGLGLLLLVYYAAWYLHRVTTTSAPTEYTRTAFRSDLLDVATLIVGFVGLGFPFGAVRPETRVLAYLAVAMIPAGAIWLNEGLIEKGQRATPKARALRAGMLLTAVIGIVFSALGAFAGVATPDDPWFRLRATEVGAIDVAVLVVLWLILRYWLYTPQAFDSGRSSWLEEPSG